MISAGLFVLVTGLLLGLYEDSAYREKETRNRNELTAIALTANNILMAANPCPLDDTFPNSTKNFAKQGYAVNGCYKITQNTTLSTTKANLLVPSNFNCLALVNGIAVTAQNGGCTDQIGMETTDIVSLDRAFLIPKDSKLTKLKWEKCLILNFAELPEMVGK